MHGGFISIQGDLGTRKAVIVYALEREREAKHHFALRSLRSLRDPFYYNFIPGGDIWQVTLVYLYSP